MLFNSIDFLIFFPIVVTLLFITPQRFRWLLLLIASCVFYMAFIPVYILILALTIIVDYVAGIYIEKESGKKRKLFLIISIVTTCLILFVFKYFNFFNTSFANVAEFFHLNYPISIINIILPIGLSFHTFQSLSYVIEVYRGNQKAERHFGIYSVYVMFFPQLVAGPIERPQNLLHQFRERHHFEYARVTEGVTQMLWGFFKKVVIADRLSIAVNSIYNNPAEYKGLPLIIATVFFAIQIFCDFSGYSDIAIGSAKVMGFNLMDNFNRPYFSKSISEFWKRWHISLSTWFKDYVYIPLGGNRVGKSRHLLNLMITFTISGLWHGAKWTFVIWGILHGTYLVFSILTENIRKKIVNISKIKRIPFLYKIFRVLITFCLVCFAWVFFRANTFSDAIYIIQHMFVGIGNSLSLGGIRGMLSTLSIPKFEFITVMLCIGLMEYIHLIERKQRLTVYLNEINILKRWAFYNIVFFTIITIGVFGNEAQFIYFQF